MKVKVFDFAYRDEAGGFDDGPLQEFLVDKEIISFTEHHYTHGGLPHLVLVLSYRELSLHQASVKKTKAMPKKKQNWRSSLSSEQQVQYDLLAKWRGEKAKAEGIPPYVILTNRILAELVVKRPVSLSAMGEINGIGLATREKYGEEILLCLFPEEESSVSDSVNQSESTGVRELSGEDG